MNDRPMTFKSFAALRRAGVTFRASRQDEPVIEIRETLASRTADAIAAGIKRDMQAITKTRRPTAARPGRR